MPFKLGVLGIDHGHIFGMLSNMEKQGCRCDAYWTDGEAVTEAKFNQVFPKINKFEYTEKGFDRIIDPDKAFFWGDLHPESDYSN